MKAVLLSIKPKYCELIANGKKIIEVRKTRPKVETPFKCYIYCTKAKEKRTNGGIGYFEDELYRIPDGETKYGWSIELAAYSEEEWNEDNFLNGKVIGEFVCNKITTIFYGCEIMYGIDYPNKHAKQLEDDSCLSLKELKHYANAKDVYGWHISDLKIYDKPKELSEFRKPCKNDLYCESCGMYSEYSKYCGNAALHINRPPQSWCYIEENNSVNI